MAREASKEGKGGGEAVHCVEVVDWGNAGRIAGFYIQMRARKAPCAASGLTPHTFQSPDLHSGVARSLNRRCISAGDDSAASIYSQPLSQARGEGISAAALQLVADREHDIDKAAPNVSWRARAEVQRPQDQGRWQSVQSFMV